MAILQALALCTILWVLWKYFRQVVVKFPLDNVPGPKAESFLWGTAECHKNDYLIVDDCLVTGNMGQILNRNGWGTIHHLTETYPGIARLHGPLGVSQLVLIFNRDSKFRAASRSLHLRPLGDAQHNRQRPAYLRRSCVVP